MHKKMLIYENGGNGYLGEYQLLPADFRIYKNDAKMRGYIGYLSGYRRDCRNESQSVVVFFKKQPSKQEILRRRNNGFLAARWYWL